MIKYCNFDAQHQSAKLIINFVYKNLEVGPTFLNTGASFI